MQSCKPLLCVYRKPTCFRCSKYWGGVQCPTLTPPPPPPHTLVFFLVVAESREVLPGKVLESTVAGDQVLVTRTTAGPEGGGQVSVVDPYCPHLGANMVAGGVVKGESIQCPFHNWSFDLKTGKCTGIPYAKKAPNYGQVCPHPNSYLTRLIDGDPKGLLSLDPCVLQRTLYRIRTYQGFFGTFRKKTVILDSGGHTVNQTTVRSACGGAWKGISLFLSGITLMERSRTTSQLSFPTWIET